MRAQKHSKSYAINWCLGNSGQLAHLNEISAAVGLKYALEPDVVRHALAHLIVAAESQSAWDNQKWSYIPWFTWREIGGSNYNRVTKALRTEGYVDVRPYDKEKQRCFGFRLYDKFVVDYYSAGLQVEDDFRMFNLVNGKVTTRRAKTQLRDETNNYFYGSANHPCQMMLKVMAKSTCVYGDRTAFLAELREYVAELRKDGSPPAMGRLANVLTCAAPIISGVGNSYRPVYKVTSTGRLQEVGGALQGICRRMKHAAWQPMIDKGLAFNYDMCSAQVKVYLKLVGAMNSRGGYDRVMGEGGDRKIDATALRNYVDSPGHKKAYQEALVRAGAKDMDAAKQIVIGTLMGLGVRSMDEFVRSDSDVPAVREALHWLTDITNQVKKILIRDLKADATRYRQRKSRLPRMSELMHISTTGQGVYVRNAANICANVMDTRGNWLPSDDGTWWIGKVLAHVLQGAEVRYVSEIVWRLPAVGVNVLSWQHDGLVTDREIPDCILAEAAKASTLGSAAIMRIKGFGYEKKEKTDETDAEQVHEQEEERRPEQDTGAGQHGGTTGICQWVHAPANRFGGEHRSRRQQHPGQLGRSSAVGEGSVRLQGRSELRPYGDDGDSARGGALHVPSERQGQGVGHAQDAGGDHQGTPRADGCTPDAGSERRVETGGPGRLDACGRGGRGPRTGGSELKFNQSSKPPP